MLYSKDMLVDLLEMEVQYLNEAELLGNHDEAELARNRVAIGYKRLMEEERDHELA